MSIERVRTVMAVLMLCWTASSTAVAAQDAVIDPFQQPGTIKIITTQEVPATVPVQQPAQPAEQQPGQEGEAKPGETAEAKPEGEQAKKEDEPKVIKRPTDPPPNADPKELDVVPVDGMVGFQFRGQAWPDVIDWLGRISNMSVDWQELPADYLNVSTQRLYTVAEARDLINWHLLARGFTLLEHDGFLSVAKTETLSAGRVPRVSVSQLDTLLPHTYVRVMFPLDWMVAEEAAEELQPLLSKNGKLHPLRHTNRLDVVDAVVNVRQVRDVLAEEQSVESQERLVKEFVLAHVRADDVARQLGEFLGLEGSSAPSAPSGPMSPEQMQMMQQQMAMQAQMQARMAQQQQAGGRPKREEEPVRILVNRIKNSVLVSAPPDKMAVVAETVQLLDVAANAPESLQSYLSRMQVHHVTQLDPAKLVMSLKELGGLEPSTRLEVDAQNRAIIAYASPADHFLIQSLIERLDTGARKVAVVQLRRLEADQVAGTIEYLFTRNESNESSGPYYDPFMGFMFGGRSRRQPAPDEFRVDADIVNNRLIVKANEVELAAVMDLLEQLGEIPGRGGDGTVRVLDVAPGRETEAFLRALQQRWQQISPNPLILPPGVTPGDSSDPETRDDAAADSEADAEAEATSPSATPAESKKVTGKQPFRRDPTRAPHDAIVQFAQFTQIDDAARQRPAPGQSPVLINVDAEGRLVIASQDPLALDLLEQLIQQTVLAPKNFEIFKLKNAPAWWVVLNLEDFYEDEEKGESREDRMMRMMWGMPSQQRQERNRLSANKAPRFISDTDTNTIVVKNATAVQLETIAELIELYDVPEPDDTRTARVTKLIPVKYSKASIIAETVKDAYRDLLSDNDKALAQQQQQQQNPQEPRQASGTTYITNFGGEEESQPREQRTEARFKGKLSIGVDNLTNSLLISTEGENLMRVVSDMVAALDTAAVGVNEVQVISVPGGMHGGLLQDTITRVLQQQQQQSGTPAPGPNQPVAPQPVMVNPVQARPPVQIEYSGGF